MSPRTHQHLDSSRLHLARQMLYQLPEWGEWARSNSQFDTPFGPMSLCQAAILYALRVQLVNPPPTLHTLAAHLRKTLEEIEVAIEPLYHLELVALTAIENKDDQAGVQLTPLGLEVSHWIADQTAYQIAAELDRLDDAALEHLESVLDLLNTILVHLKSGK